MTTATPADYQDKDDAIVTQGTSTAIVGLPEVLAGERNIAYVTRLMDMLPPADEDVIDAIAGQILDAASMVDENMLWDATGSKDAVGKRFTFYSVHISPSDFAQEEDALWPYFLICKVMDHQSGERTVLTTGSTNIMVALVKAQILGQLPWEAEIVGPRKPTRKGRLPLHLRWIAKVVED